MTDYDDDDQLADAYRVVISRHRKPSSIASRYH